MKSSLQERRVKMANEEALKAARDVDDKWQMYVDGIITKEELQEWRANQGLAGDWLTRVVVSTEEL